MLGNLKRWHTGYPHALKRCLYGSACRVACESRPGFSDNELAVALIAPSQVGEPFEGDAVEVRQIFGALWRSKRFKESGTGKGDGADHAHPRRDQCRVLKDADPERSMELLLDEVDAPVGEHDPHVDLGMHLEEFEDNRQGEPLAEGCGKRDRTLSARLTVFSGCC